MISPARRISFNLLLQIESRQVFSDDALNSAVMTTVETRDRHLITEIVYGTIRRQSLLDYMLGQTSARSWSDTDKEVRILLRMSLYQMWFMERIPDHAIVNDAVELAKIDLQYGIERYVNGILRHMSKNRPWEDARNIQKAPQWVQASLPRWLWKRWVKRYGANTAEEFASSLNTPPQASLRLEAEPDRTTLPFSVRPSDLVPGAYIRGSDSGKVHKSIKTPLSYQDEASQLIPHLLGHIQGWTLWDACAAPGGKTAVLCSKCGETGRVVASDKSTRRIPRLAQTLNAGRYANSAIVVADASRPAPFRRQFDAAVADVPCSGLGTLRRNPEIKWRFRPSDFASFQKNQLSILCSVSETVRPGGRLLYSTCSTEPEENEQVVESFLDSHPDFFIESPVCPSGIQSWTGMDKMVRTFPETRLWDGFFAALMVRKE